MCARRPATSPKDRAQPHAAKAVRIAPASLRSVPASPLGRALGPRIMDRLPPRVLSRVKIFAYVCACCCGLDFGANP